MKFEHVPRSDDPLVPRQRVDVFVSGFPDVADEVLDLINLAFYMSFQFPVPSIAGTIVALCSALIRFSSGVHVFFTFVRAAGRDTFTTLQSASQPSS